MGSTVPARVGLRVAVRDLVVVDLVVVEGDLRGKGCVCLGRMYYRGGEGQLAGLGREVRGRGLRTGLWEGYFRGSLTWSAGSLMGFLSRVVRKVLAKVISDMMCLL